MVVEAATTRDQYARGRINYALADLAGNLRTIVGCRMDGEPRTALADVLTEAIRNAETAIVEAALFTHDRDTITEHLGYRAWLAHERTPR